MKISPHCHPESPLTGSTLSTLINRAKELGRTHFAHTDHGHLSSAMKTYAAAKKAGLKFIPGIEIYFKDNQCPIIQGTSANRCKYFTLSLYCEDQAAYQELCKIVSKTNFATISIYEQPQQLWTWTDLERISNFNVNIVLGGIHCIVGKTLLAGHPDLAEKVLIKLSNIFGKENVYTSLLCEPWLKKWQSVVQIYYEDGTSDCLLASDQITTDRARRIKAIDLTTRAGHQEIKSKSVAMTAYDVNKRIKEVVPHKGFLPLPGGDASLKINRFLKAMSARHGLTLLATDYAYYANREDKVVQTMRLDGNDKLHSNLHMKTEHEILQYLIKTLNIQPIEAQQILKNNESWAAKFDNLKLEYSWRLANAGESPIRQAMELIKKNGRMKWDNPVWVARLKEELEVIAKNPVKDLTSYFLPISDVLNHYKANGQLTGPGRGSAGGSLFCYLLGITQIDPFEYDLPFQRFFSLDRIIMKELPDIDVDLEARELLVGDDGHSGYLYGRWGDKAAQISTRTTIRLKSAIKDTARYFHGKVPNDVEVFSKGLPAPPQGVNDHDFVFGFEDQEGNHVQGLIETSEDLKKYAEAHPREWDTISKAMGITRAFSKHASAFVLSDIPIQNTVPTRDGNVTQYEAKESEAAGLIKYDFLVIHQLRDIRVCLDLINKKNSKNHVVGNFDHDGKETYIWALPKDPEVFKSIWDGQTETCFQINTKSMTPFVKQIMPHSIIDLATILALVRPGPMDFIDADTGRNMTEEYVQRRNGSGKDDLPELLELLPETYGIITFQEQLNKIARDLAGFSGPAAETLRKHMAKKKMVELMKIKPSFIEGARKKVSQEIAEGIWERMVTFGRYGFSIIHAVEYAHITYACMFLKHHYPLEWWAAVLTNAEEQEITGKFWPYVKERMMPPDINLSGDTMVVDYRTNKIRSKMGVIRGMGDASIEPIVNNRPYKDIEHFVNLEVAGQSLSHKLIHVGVLDSLFPSSSSLKEKFFAYENAVEQKKFSDKVKEAQESGKKLCATGPKQATVPEEWLEIEQHPFKNAAAKKSVLPSLVVDLHALGKKYSKVLKKNAQVPIVKNLRNQDTVLVNGEILKRLDELDGEAVREDRYVAATCFVVKAEEFSYPKAKPTKRALKLILDADGYVSEKVLWPDYDSGELNYPKELKKNSIATVFFRKKAGRKDMSISSVVVET